jgi:hypothetical protein
MNSKTHPVNVFDSGTLSSLLPHRHHQYHLLLALADLQLETDSLLRKWNTAVEDFERTQ